ncbi:FxSxx-COOH system tetratricopeptide repeat protein [Streptomyces sp. NPDC006879]|uniref:FxSxx-COOH system tetratricopeptide repeat protein n=1 Tax=Streptomyces sp. NPDC006879 TaxID=3364767 RepID=UPI003697F973
MPNANPLDPTGPFNIFLATSENLGLSTTLRNVADILAEANRSVLLVDARADGPVRGPVPPPEPGRVHAHTAPGAEALSELTADRVAARYDHVLIEAPVPDAPDAAEPSRLAGHASALVICFAMTAWSIDGAAALAEDLTVNRTGRPLPLLTLGLKSDVRVHDRLRDARERVRRRFGPLAWSLGGADIPFLEVPYNPLYQDSRSLAVEAEGVGTVTGLRPYYERLADWLRARRTVGLTGATIVHSTRHAPWAAWLCDQLAAKGVRSQIRRADTYSGERPEGGAALLFLSPDPADDTLLAQIGALSHTDVRIVLVDEPFPNAEAAHHERIDLRGTTEEEALRLLYTGLALGSAEPDASATARFPRLPETTNVTPRGGGYIDRDELLAELGEQLLTAGQDSAALVVHGPSGWGKSEAAHEFCHRDGAGYDIVWWVRSWERERAERALSRLAARLNGPRDQLAAEDDTVSHLLSRLSRPEETSSWLLVYDGVSDLNDLRGLLPVPHERGHVLITSRVPPESEDGPGQPSATQSTLPGLTGLAIPTMTFPESRTLLADRVNEITEHQARQVGSVTDFVPHALRIAAHCLAVRVAVHLRDDHLDNDTAVRVAVEDLLTEYRVVKTAMLRHTEAVSPVAVMVRVARRVVQSTPGATAWRTESAEPDALDWLLKAASLLTGRGMGLELLRSRRILSELARDDDAVHSFATGAHRHPDSVQLPEEDMVSVALWALAQVGLLEVDFDREDQPLAQHHGLRDLIRAEMDPATRRRIESVLRGALAEFAPQANQDLPADWAREVYSLRLWKDPRPRVRRSLLRHVNALSQRAEAADLDRVLDIAARAEREWRVEGDEQSPEYLRLLNLTARAHRLRGEYKDSRRLAQDALRGHRRLLGITHPRTLLSADSYAATLRALGRFEDALLELRPAQDGLVLLLGWKHSATIQVEHNLALTEALTGRVADALTRIQERFRYRQAVGGKDDRIAWESADLLAYLHRCTGRDGEARDLLRQWLRRHTDTWDVTRLRAEVGLAISERRLADGFPAVKDPKYGYELAHERDLRALRNYTERFGPDRYDTLRCQFSYAADLHVLGKIEEAELHARQCGGTLAGLFGAGHPYTVLCQVRHGVYLRATGELRLAEEVGRNAFNVLAHKLGQAHPWVAAAENSLAATVAADGRTEEAIALARAALVRLRDLGVVHRPDGRRVRAHHDRLAELDSERPPPASGYDIDLELPGV